VDVSGRESSLFEVNACRGHELVSSLHEAIDAWKRHWKEKSVSKSVKTVDIGRAGITAVQHPVTDVAFRV
jgi:hypothetical protein